MGENPIDKMFREGLNEVPTPEPTPVGWTETLSAAKAAGAMGSTGAAGGIAAGITGKVIIGGAIVGSTVIGGVLLSESEVSDDTKVQENSVVEVQEQVNVIDENTTITYEEAQEFESNGLVKAAGVELDGSNTSGSESSVGVVSKDDGLKNTGSINSTAHSTSVVTSGFNAAENNNQPSGQPKGLNASANSNQLNGTSGSSNSNNGVNSDSDPGTLVMAGSADIPATPVPPDGHLNDEGANITDRPLVDDGIGSVSVDNGGDNKTASAGNEDETTLGEEATNSTVGFETGSTGVAESNMNTEFLDAIAQQLEVRYPAMSDEEAVLGKNDSLLMSSLSPIKAKRYAFMPFFSVDHADLNLGIAPRYGSANGLLALNEDPGVNFTLGGRFIYRPTTRLSVQTGFYYSKKGKISGLLVDESDLLLTSFDLDLDYIEVPLLVNYRVPMEGFGINLTAGGLIQKNLNSDLDVISEVDLNNGMLTTVNLNSGSANVSGFLGVGLDFRISRNTRLLIEPSYRFAMGQVIRPEDSGSYVLPIDPKVNSFGLGTGVMINLF